jgi:hypothetical protein
MTNLARTPTMPPEQASSFPIAVVEITMRVAGSGLDLGPRATTLPGQNVITGGWIRGGQVGIQIGDPERAGS